MKKTVSEIWNEVLEGHSDAWTQLVRMFAPLVFTVARRAGLSQTDAEDCVQQTWIALYRGRNNIKDPSRLPAWLLRVASRVAMRLVREQARQQLVSRQAETSTPAIPPDEVLQRLERLTHLEIGLSQLDRRCSKVLREVFLAPPDKTYRDIAADLGIAPNSLGPTRMRCLQKLRKILEALGYL